MSYYKCQYFCSKKLTFLFNVLNFCSKWYILIYERTDYMNIENTAIRLKKIMDLKNLKQVDLLEIVKPYCNKYNINYKLIYIPIWYY